MNLAYQKNGSEAAPRRNGMAAKVILICFVVALTVPAFAQDFGYQGGGYKRPHLSCGWRTRNYRRQPRKLANRLR